MPSLRIGTGSQVKVIASGSLGGGGGGGGKLVLLSDVNSSNLTNGSFLVYDSATAKFVTQTNLPSTTIDGGEY